MCVFIIDSTVRMRQTPNVNRVQGTDENYLEPEETCDVL